jgi:hypothetical protein
MKAFFLCASVSLLLLFPGFAQEDFTAVHQDDFARWSQVTRLSPADIHHMWRSTSHYAEERDDDSSIDLVDVKSLCLRNQILMVTSAGLPQCLTAAVFSRQPTFPKLWQVGQTPGGHGFCDALSSPAKVHVTREGEIDITTAVSPVESSQPEVHTYAYKWDGKTYVYVPSLR